MDLLLNVSGGSGARVNVPFELLAYIKAIKKIYIKQHFLFHCLLSLIKYCFLPFKYIVRSLLLLRVYARVLKAGALYLQALSFSFNNLVSEQGWVIFKSLVESGSSTTKTIILGLLA